MFCRVLVIVLVMVMVQLVSGCLRVERARATGMLDEALKICMGEKGVEDGLLLGFRNTIASDEDLRANNWWLPIMNHILTLCHSVASQV